MVTEVTLEEDLLPHDLTICEDPVRILRIARFAARFANIGFTIAEETQILMKGMVKAGEVDALVPERVWQEMEKALQEPDPAQFFLVLKECGALVRLWPALYNLWGVPQRAEYHPEIDTGIHTLLALKEAVQLTPDPITRFAVICHDLGKGKTPADILPSHRGHEERGVPLIREFCKHFRVPNEYRDLAVLVSRYHLHCHRAAELTARTLLKTLESLDAFRQPQRFEKFLLACLADKRGRTGFEKVPYPQMDIFQEALKAAKGVEVKPLVEQGLSGERLGKKLREKRIHAIDNIPLVRNEVSRMSKSVKKGPKKKGKYVVKKKRGRKAVEDGVTLTSMGHPNSQFDPVEHAFKKMQLHIAISYDKYFLENFIGKYVVCRGYYAGIHAGILVAYNCEHSHLILQDARRLWRWESDFTLSEVAVKGLIAGAKIAVVTPKIMVRGVDEIMPCTKEAEKSIREYPVYIVPEDER